MNVADVTKHKEVILWFLENPEKCVCVKNFRGWHLEHSPVFLADSQYVQNDEYALLRMALADGETIEFKPPRRKDNGIWRVDEENHFRLPVECYRVKSNETMYLAEDWVVYNGDIVRVEDVKCVDEEWLCCLDTAQYDWVLQADVTEWKAKRGEPVVIHNETKDIFTIEDYIEQKHNTYPYTIYPLEYAMTLRDE